MIQIDCIAPNSPHLLQKYFEGWKRYCERYRRSVENNITANHHYLLKLFRKSVEAIKMHSNFRFKKLVFERLKRATLESIREVLQSRIILVTMRKRVALHSIIKAYRYRKRIQRALQVSMRYTNLTIERKYFGELKVNTLLYKLREKRSMRLLREECKTFVSSLRRLQLASHISKEKNAKAVQHYRLFVQRTYLERLKLGGMANSYQVVRSRFIKKYLCLLVKTYRRLQLTNNRKASTHLRETLLKKYFGRLSSRTITLKTIKLTSVRKLTKCFNGWLSLTRASKQQQENIPIELVSSIEQVHRYQTKKQWFGKLKGIYEGRLATRNKQQMIDDYYELKSTEVLYREYFWRIRLFGLIGRADKYHSRELYRKVFQGLQLNFIARTNQQIKFEEFIAKREQKATRKVWSILGRALKKLQKSNSFRRLHLQRKYLGAWLQSVVTTHLKNISRAAHYHSTNLKYKAIFALTDRVELGKKMLNVVRIKLKGYLHRWVCLHRVFVANHERELTIKAKVFRQLKLRSYTRR